jgi:hypothetical protein
MKEADLYGMITHVMCLTCGARHEVKSHGIDFKNEDDVQDESTYELFDCCADPTFIGIIFSSSPVFQDEDVNDDALIAANPGLGIRQDVWKYEVTDDLIDQLEVAGEYEA